MIMATKLLVRVQSHENGSDSWLDAITKSSVNSTPKGDNRYLCLSDIVLMKITITYEFDLDDGTLSADELESNRDLHLAKLSDIVREEGRLVLLVNGEDVCGEYSDPLLRLVEQWLRKVTWVISGDTETLALRNSQQCFAFVPSGGAIELSFFDGTELEVDDYLFEPTNIRLEDLVSQSIAVGDNLLGVLNAVDSSLVETDDDCSDFRRNLDELRKTWRDHQVRQRR